MSDRTAAASPPPDPTAAAEQPADFDEIAYMVAFPKIAEAIRGGAFKSAFEHYTRRGIAENRLAEPRYRKALAAQQQLRALAMPAEASAYPPGQAHGQIDTVLVADENACVVIGWIDDRAHPLTSIALHGADGSRFVSSTIARCRRADAEAVTGAPSGTLLGFWTIIEAPLAACLAAGTTILLGCGQQETSHPVRPKPMEAASLRDAAFEYLASATYFGAAAVESFSQLETGIGDQLLRLNQAVSARITAGAYVERHGPTGRAFAASIIVCLFGRLEYLFLQAAFFSTAAGAADYEFVYVCNSPELAEPLQREARLAAQLYGLSITLVILPGNAGFGAANNAAVRHASSNRLIMLNPDVFPRDPGWTGRHAALLAQLPAAQTSLFGAPLFYDDGSLMHGGMFIDIDVGLSVTHGGIVRRDLLRVEHFAKGAPPDTSLYQKSRRVPAVTGAFMSADRGWFERLGGFSEAYAFGHYEDADLCLRSWAAGGAVWLHNFPMWHLEGKGSTRRPPHEGGSIANRWHFTRTWIDTVRASFCGPDPQGIRQ
jgi:GT2 family glycosyltransferase